MSALRPENYLYTKIARQSFRVLVLHAASEFSSPLTCDLVDQKISDTRFAKSQYHAVSYCWGDPKPSHELICDNKSIGITRNADSLLRHFRKAHKSHRLWLDSVCINQRDNEEKVDQLALMGTIYRLAACVHIWLGEADALKTDPFEFLRALAITPEREVHDSHKTQQMNDQHAAKGLITWSPSEDELEQVLLVSRLLERPWFRRRWVLQEVGLSRDAKVHCGPHAMSHGVFIESLERFRLSKLDQDIAGLVDLALATLTCRRRAETSILEYLYSFRSSLCSDPRDSIFSLLSLASEEWLRDTGKTRTTDSKGAITFQPTYEIPCQAIYEDFTTSCISAGYVVHVLCLAARFPLSSPAGVSSWVPDWSMSQNSVCLPPTRRKTDKMDLSSVRDTIAWQEVVHSMWTTTQITPEPHHRDGQMPDIPYCLWLRGDSGKHYSTRQVCWAGESLPTNASRTKIAAVLRNWLASFVVDDVGPPSAYGWYSAYSSYPAFKRAKEHKTDDEAILRGGNVRRKMNAQEQVEHYRAVQNACIEYQTLWGAHAATPEDRTTRKAFADSGCRDNFNELLRSPYSRDLRGGGDKVYAAAHLFGIDCAGWIPLCVLPKIYCTMLCEEIDLDWFDISDDRRAGFMELLDSSGSQIESGRPKHWWQQLHTWQIRSETTHTATAREDRIEAFCSSLLSVAGGRSLCMVEPHTVFNEFRENYHTESYSNESDEEIPVDEKDIILGAPGAEQKDVFLTWRKSPQISMLFGPSNVNDGYRLRGDAFMLRSFRPVPELCRGREILINA